jgi:hypothetical protein
LKGHIIQGESIPTGDLQKIILEHLSSVRLLIGRDISGKLACATTYPYLLQDGHGVDVMNECFDCECSI